MTNVHILDIIKRILIRFVGKFFAANCRDIIDKDEMTFLGGEL